MKRLVTRILILLIVVLTIFAFGCNNTPKRPGTVKGSVVAEASAEGLKYNNGVELTFDENMTGFSISSLPFNDNHDCVSCEDCGIVDYEGTKAFKIDNSHISSAASGVLVTLDYPIDAALFSEMTFTYRTSADSTKSEIRITRYDASTRGEYKNDAPEFSGAGDKWRTINVGISSMDSLADENGYIKAFGFHIRNYEKTDFYISNITFKINLDSLCEPKLDPQKCMYESGTAQYIADTIKDNLESAGIGAKVSVNCEEYTQNTAIYEGKIKYYVDLDFGDKKYFTDTITKVIPAASGMWLVDGDDAYGATQEIDSSWKKNFNNDGILSLGKSTITCDEDIKAVEYACFTSDKKYTHNDIEWLKAHEVKLNKNGIKKVFINAFLDYGSQLVEGQSYCLAVRTVTKNNNYILNINHEFTYQHYDKTICETLLNAMEMISTSYFEAADAKSLKEVLSQNADTKVAFDVTLSSEGLHSNNYTVKIKNTSDKAFSYDGKAFVARNVAAWHDSSSKDKQITLISPYDGQIDIVLAQEYIVSHFKNPFGTVINPDYENYSPAEICTPPGIKFQWTDKNSNPEEEYVLHISTDINFSNAITRNTSETSYEVYNLQPGVKYYWKVTCGTEESPVLTFTVDSGYTRFLKIEGVNNIRDMGGYVTANGKRVKYGLMYRSANIDGITKNGLAELRDRLGVRTDVDYRGDQGRTPLGSSASYIPVPISWYHGIFTEEALELIRESIALYADEANYPMVYHCAIGRDRTGTMSVLILGLLGVDEETLIREYHLSFYSQMGGYSPSEQIGLYENNIIPFLNGLRTYGDEDDTIQEAIEKFALKIGVTREEIESIRTLLLEDAPIRIDEDNTTGDDDNDETGCGSSSAIAQIMFLMASVVIIKKKSSCK